MPLLTQENLRKVIKDLKEEIFDDVMEEVEKLFQEISQGGLDIDVSKFKEQLRGDIGPKGPPGEPGKDADETQIVLDVIAKIPKPKDGIDGKQGEKGEPGKDAVDTPKQIKEKLESLQGENRLNAFAIQGIRELISRYGTKFGNAGGGGGGGDTVRVSDLSSQLDGSTSAFTMPLAARVLLLIGTEFPIIYRPTIDFTTSETSSSQTTITLVTGQVAAPQRGQSLLALYVSG